ncbi:tetratricopeptide repeat protein [Derxia lacustris]|uniref:hypothetical protein n=1 Tax=Derxia lacustris TaxID=764842 RepID=UPI00111C7862|nr:hypothetical protein [Derxia lacustris]
MSRPLSELRPGLRRVAWRLTTAGLLLWAGVAGWQWLAAERVNRAIEARLTAAAPTGSPSPAASAPATAADAPPANPLAELAAPEAALADGIAEAGAGRTLEALAAWRKAGQGGDPAVAADAWFNTGNLYLRQARALAADGRELDRVGALAELAKDAYRRALAVAPTDWGARYNLQRALQWFPDADDDGAALPPAPARERAVTTMRAWSLGLP